MLRRDPTPRDLVHLARCERPDVHPGVGREESLAHLDLGHLHAGDHHRVLVPPSHMQRQVGEQQRLAHTGPSADHNEPPRGEHGGQLVQVGPRRGERFGLPLLGGVDD